MGIVKTILLLPLLPLRLAWKWSSGAKATSSGALWNKKDEFGNDIVIEKGGCLPRLMGTVIIAAILYSLIGWAIMSIVQIFQK